MAQPGVLFHKSDKLARSQAQVLRFRYRITGAKTVAAEPTVSLPILTGWDSTDLTTALVTAFFTGNRPGATTTIDGATSFGSTAMGTDAFGFVIDTEGSVAQVVSARVSCVQTAGGTPANTELLVLGTQGAAALPNTLTSAIGVSAEGDIYGHFVMGNVDAATAGFIDIEIFYRSK